MSYYQGIPQNGQSLGNSKPQVRTNFQTIYDKFLINHIAYDSAGAGKHTYVQLVSQGSDPATAANEIATYAKTDSGIVKQFFRAANNGSSWIISGPTPTNANNGNTYLAGGLRMAWGESEMASSGEDTFGFGITFGGVPYSMVILPFSNGIGGPKSQYFYVLKEYPAGNATFTVRFSSGPQSLLSTFPIKFKWIAIGPQ